MVEPAFFSLIQRLEDTPSLAMGPEEFAPVDDSALQQLMSVGLIVPGPPASLVVCGACFEDHSAEVLYREQGSESVPFMNCPLNGLVRLTEAELRTGQLAPVSLARLLQSQLSTAGLCRERYPGRAWDLGRAQIGKQYINFWLLRGTTWPDADRVFGSLDFRENAVLLTTAEHHQPLLALRQIPLTAVLSFGAGGVLLDMRQLANELQEFVLEELPDGPFTFRREGDIWTIRFKGGERLRLHDQLGLRYLHELLGRPGERVSVIDLELRGRAMSEVQRALAIEAPLEATDPQTLKALGDARTDASTSSADMVQIEKYLNGNSRIGGGSRKVQPAVETRRISVKSAIVRAIRKINNDDAGLAGYLRKTVKTGASCSYEPSPDSPKWQL